MSGTEFLAGEVQALPSRGINEETCRKFGYMVGTQHGKPVQIAPFRNADGELVAQKVRDREKNFSVIGNGRDMPLFAQHLWPSSGRRVVVTEGELDCLSVAQAAGLNWPVVSLPNGAQSARKAVQRALEWLMGFDKVIFCFDMDEPGRAAAVECAALLPPGKAFIVETPRKDANECLKAGLVTELSQALWNAREYRPDGIVTLADIMDRIVAEPEVGRPYPWAGLNEVTYGRRLGEVIGLGGGSGCGKTDWFTTMIAHDVCKLGVKTGVIYLEQSVAETGKRIAGKIAGRRFHVPGEGSADDLRAALAQIPDGLLHLYDSWGALDWATVASRIRYMVTSLGVEHIYLDHLTALAAAEDDERKALEKIMAEAASMAQSLKFVLHFVSHLATPEGKPHEEGGRVMGRHFKGSRAIMYWSHFLWGLERDTQQPGTPTILRGLKDRFSGAANGRVWGLQYDTKTGLLSECELTEGPFGDESERDF